MTAPSPATRRETGTDKLLAEVAGHIATVTFNNPAKRNALSADMRAALPPLLAALDADRDIRVVVVTGGGDKAFASGADISEFGAQRTDPGDRAAYDRDQAALTEAWASVGKPVIALIRGFCLGGGLVTALQADIRIASDDSQFGIPAARLGLGYGFSGVTALMSLIGPARAAELLFSARRFPADEALRMGLVNQVVPAGALQEAGYGLARAIAGNAPLTVAAAKAAIREASRPPGERDLARVQAMVEACFRSADYREGQRAFAGKRPPAFTGQLRLRDPGALEEAGGHDVSLAAL
jgi:enoyl-CoA hydratase